MIHMRISRRARWAIPAGALAVIGGVAAGSVFSGAQAAPGLPARTASQLLSEAVRASTPPLTGTIVESASLGLPALPGMSNSMSPISLLAGSHTLRIWYSDPDHYRLSAPGELSEADLIRDSSTVWVWNSIGNSVTKYTLAPNASAPSLPAAPTNPQQTAKAVLASVGATTTVSAQSNVSVAGVAAYQLVLAPKDKQSLIGQVTIAIDGSNGVPLRVQVFARGADTPAIQVGYTAIQFVPPAPSELSFTPPPGATVMQGIGGLPGLVTGINGGPVWAKVCQAVSTARAVNGRPAWPVRIVHRRPAARCVQLAVPSTNGGLSGGSTEIGTGWMTVWNLSSGTPGPDGPQVGAGSLFDAVLGQAATVHGAWGSGRLLRTGLLSVLATSNGHVLIGAVEPSVLYAAAATLK
jgi:outer membrane lipoprotein-sorting protein